MVSASRDFKLNKYPFLAELGLREENLGCYRRGEWVGGDKEQLSVNPHNNEKLAVTKTATLAQYQECIHSMAEERARW